MATRGYLTLINSEKNVKDSYLGFKKDHLIEAHHDGYVKDIIKDILSIPFRFNILFDNPKLKYDKMNFYNIYERLNPTLPELTIIFDFIYFDFYNLLTLTVFGKYHLVDEGSIRYGHLINIIAFNFFQVLTLIK